MALCIVARLQGGLLLHRRFKYILPGFQLTSGSIYGFHNTPFNHTLLRPSPKGPLEQLYFVGAWTQPGGGFAPAILSGGMTGARVVKQLRS